ncbi:DUF5666 domain-containing protein [Rhodohalobacter sp. 8-1]|uniref:DUF5666 domain-containing protein n=1 Tax=Rhodohalobacter sp. 8-1 TaxID=3131972 RepID=UPI0030EB7C86
MAISGLLILSACSIDGFENTSAPITDEETQLAGQIIGESISENQRGMLSTFSEAFAVPTSFGLITGPSLLSAGSFRNQENYSHSYDAESGEHQVSYTVRRETPLLNSETNVSLTYIFYDNDENFIEFPDQNSNRIEAVDFNSEQSGSITTASKNSVFSRTDRIIMSGLTDNSETLTLDGFHSGEGVFSSTMNSGDQIQREYILDMNYLDVRIDKSVVLANRNFRNGVNGALSYESTVRDMDSQSGNTKIVNGTIELNGDGTALLNFREQIEPIRLRLDDGKVFDEDEFEGRIIELNLDERIFTIANGQRIQIDNQTEIDDGEYQTLEDVAAAISNNRRIIAEGDYFHPYENVNLWIATTVEFEEESNEFEDLVVSVNEADNSFTLSNGDQLFITNDSDIEFNDGLSSLQDVANAVESGLPVLADGDFTIDPGSGNRLIAEVDFKMEFEEFEAIVTAADSVANSFSLDNGRDVMLTPETVIEGDFSTISDVQIAIENGLSIEADGEYYLGASGETWIAVQVSFDEDDSDGNSDDDDNGDGDDDGEED